jgi:hypothetical protein
LNQNALIHIKFIYIYFFPIHNAIFVVKVKERERAIKKQIEYFFIYALVYTYFCSMFDAKRLSFLSYARKKKRCGIFKCALALFNSTR